MADNEIEMVVVDGVRYRPEHAPKRAEVEADNEKARRTPNKARKAVANKAETPEA